MSRYTETLTKLAHIRELCKQAQLSQTNPSTMRPQVIGSLGVKGLGTRGLPAMTRAPGSMGPNVMSPKTITPQPGQTMIDAATKSQQPPKTAAYKGLRLITA